MKTFTYKDIVSWDPCYDPIKYIPKDWEGTIVDILDLNDCSFKERLWVVLRPDFLSEKLVRLFAVWCARQVQHLMKDKRNLEALDVAERFANGLATQEELDAAREAAWAAARDARNAWVDARYARNARNARNTAWAALAAARAARDAAWVFAWVAALDAARNARNAAWAVDAAWYDATASDAVCAQEKKLREMIQAGIKTGDVF